MRHDEATGTRIGPYEILSLLGAGGMGEVYRARDTKLHREVALKILPAAFARDPERFTRFQREAHVLASLNHPNIAQVYGFEDTHDVQALVMELVDGPTLDEVIARAGDLAPSVSEARQAAGVGPRGKLSKAGLSLPEALPIARQIAEALEAAHDQGIVHRDLKPANIKVKADGSVKVLDFGLAKALGGDASASGDIANSPTITSPAMTQQGVILGTAPYMAPEQARGRPVDKRADIWAFGVVLAEMVTGRQLFHGDHVTDVLAAVVKDTPDLTGVPPSLRRLIEKCLEKDPKKRLRDISSVGLLLDDSQAPISAGVAPGGGWRLSPSATLAAFAATAVLAATAAVAVWPRPVMPEPTAAAFGLDAPPGAAFTNITSGFAVSPDGQHLILSAAPSGGPSRLWHRRLDSIDARQLPGTEGGTAPVFSPDGKSVAFIAERKLKRVEIAEGSPVTLADVPCADPLQPVAWSRAGIIVWGCSRGLDSVAADGGQVTTLKKIDTTLKETAYTYPQFLADGRRFLYHVASEDAKVRGTYSSSLDDPASRKLILTTDDKAVYVPPLSGSVGYLLWADNTTLTARPSDAAALELRGAPVSVAEAVDLGPDKSTRAAFWTSESGLLLYAPALPHPMAKRALVSIDRTGKVLGDLVPEGPYNAIAIAPDQQRLAVTRLSIPRTANENGDVWLWDFPRQTMARVTFGPTTDENPAWSPDGKQLAFSSNRSGKFYQLYRKDVSGTGEDERLLETQTHTDPLDWSPDGRYLAYREMNPKTGWDLRMVPLSGERVPITLLQTPFSDSDVRFSPMGNAVAFHSGINGGQVEVYVQAFTGDGKVGLTGSRLQVSSKGGFGPLWRRDGREVYFTTPEGKLMAAAVQLEPALRVERARELFALNQAPGIRTKAVFGDGERFLVVTPTRAPQQTPRLTVVTNWQARLRN